MKSVLTYAMLLCVVIGNAQNVEVEEAIINKDIAEKRWSIEELPEIGRMWNKMKSSYPVMQYDTFSGAVIVERVATFPGVSKAQAFKRMKEWAATNFVEVAAVVKHEDLDAGKLIFKGYTEITHLTKVRFLWDTEMVPTQSNLYFTLIVTVKDERAKVRFENLRFQNYRAGYFVGSLYVPGEWVETSLRSFFPIVHKKSSTWEGAFSLLSNSAESLKLLAISMERYVRDVNNDYRF